MLNVQEAQIALLVVIVVIVNGAYPAELVESVYQRKKRIILKPRLHPKLLENAKQLPKKVLDVAEMPDRTVIVGNMEVN